MLHDHPLGSMAMPTDEIEAEVEEGDDLDDVFGSEPGSPVAGGNTEWSDIPRVREKHQTEGYRDGITKGKAESVQKGFDEGYGLGAVLGLKVGKVFGLLEGLYAAVGHTASGGEMKQEWERVGGLLDGAKAELKTEVVFGKEYWNEDGIWKYRIDGEEEGKEVTFPDVAASHPLVRKWENIITGEVRRWNLDMDIMGHGQEEKDIGKPAVAKEDGQGSTAPGAKKELSW